ncbi:: DUF1375 [Gemmataceae bacterium]|nr:: DUF1375 [Gemmataceae bacterium]VTT96485.1 : DUF1375 [Gemmataceae bacterium]
MTVRVACSALLLAALPAAGCGTVANLAHTRVEEGGREPFGGVKRDVAGLHAGSGEPGGYPHHAAAALCAADLPLSLVGDVVTWPYAKVYSAVNAPVPTPPVVIADAGAVRPPAPRALPVLPPPRPAPPRPQPAPDPLPKLGERP